VTPSLSRRRFLAATAGLAAAAALGDGFLVEPAAIRVTRHDVPLPDLPPALDGVRLACLADVHLSGGIHAPARAALARLAALRPEIVVLAGDICNHEDDLPHLVAWARAARGTVATVATFGNWEHAAGITRAQAEAAYARAGVELLVNAARRIAIGGATLAVVGLDDPVLGRPDPERALQDVRAGDIPILALHAPGYVDTLRLPGAPAPAPAPRVILAGHTHGGQIRLPFWTPYVPAGSGRFVAGWYRDTPAPLYVTRGIGTVLVPARLFCPPELPVFTLRARSPAGD
jgi:predicted MPP superfamily phosphohydrolase